MSGRSLLSSNRGSSLLTVTIIALLIAVIAAVSYKVVTSTSKKSGERRVKSNALNIAEGGKEDALMRIKSRTASPTADQRTTLIPATSFSGGTYTVACSTDAAGTTVWLWSTGVLKGNTTIIKVIATVTDPVFSITGIKGAVTSRGSVSTLGNITIDGRDHDTSGLNPDGGLFGISTCGNIIDIGGSSAVGGNDNPPPAKGAAANSIELNAPSAGFPTTPEEALGLPAGALDTKKTTGCPSSGFVGLWYSESDCDVTGSGIYILHNSSGTAALSNFHGNWKGLIIVDRVSQINGTGTLNGAMIVLSGETIHTFGNGNATMNYSSAVLNKLGEYCSTSLDRSVTVASWEQL